MPITVQRMFMAGLLFTAMIGLGACSSTLTGAATSTALSVAEAEDQQERAVLAQFAREDLQEALRSAEFHGDIIAAACWRGLLTVVERAETEGYFTEPKGAFSTYQKARNVRRKITAGISDELKLACGPLKDDSRSAILSIARTVGIPVPGIF